MFLTLPVPLFFTLQITSASCLRICRFVALITNGVHLCLLLSDAIFNVSFWGHIEFCMEYLLLCIIFTALIKAVLSYS